MPEVEHIVHLHKRAYVDGLAQLARERPARRILTCWAIRSLYEGASGLSTSLNDPAPWARARAAAEALIDQAITRARPERRRHFDVVAAAKTASLTAVGVIATTAFWVRLTISSR